LIGVACEERERPDALNRSRFVIQDEVRKFVCQVATYTRFVVEGVVDNHNSATRQTERASRERIRLDLLQPAQLTDGDKVIHPPDLDSQLLRDFRWARWITCAEPDAGAESLSYTFCLSFESPS
jgi:hypothetical protein